jgi:intracellular septation protein A
VTFKVFGVVPLTFIFAALQYPLLMKHDANPKDPAKQ